MKYNFDVRTSLLLLGIGVLMGIVSVIGENIPGAILGATYMWLSSQ